MSEGSYTSSPESEPETPSYMSEDDFATISPSKQQLQGKDLERTPEC